MSDGKILCVSDLHIKSPSDETLQSLLNLIVHAKLGAGDRLILLGDIFDLMIGKSALLKKYNSLFESLKEISDRGTLIDYVEGNHDLFITKAKRLYKISNLNIVTNSVLEFEWCGQKLHFAHGDLVNPHDKGYLFLRSFLRFPITKGLILSLPSGVVDAIGNKASDASRVYTAPDKEKVEFITNLFHDYAKKLVSDGFQYIVCGHNHLKDNQNIIEGVSVGRYINGGFFPKDRSLVYFNPETKLGQLMDEKEFLSS